jgi:hypothetical protein
MEPQAIVHLQGCKSAVYRERKNKVSYPFPDQNFHNLPKSLSTNLANKIFNHSSA